MKKILVFLVVSIFILSCQKDKQTTITGTWREISACSRDNSGEFYWSGPPKFPLVLILNEDGNYSAFYDVPVGHGIYQYAAAAKQIIFTDSTTGNRNTTTVSFLDDQYLIFDYLCNRVVEYKDKFIRVNH